MSVLSLDDAKAHLGILTSDHDEKVQAFIDAAESYIGGQIGPLEPTTITERAYLAGGRMMLFTQPILSVTSVTGTYGEPALDLSAYTVDTNANLLRLTGRSQAVYDVVYTAGWSNPAADPVVELPADLLLAVKEMLRHLWEASQRGANRRGAPSPDMVMPGYLVPNMVASLIAPYRIPGIA